MEYLISNIDLIISFILAFSKMFVEGFVLFCLVQTSVYQLSNKKINLYKRFEKHMLS